MLKFIKSLSNFDSTMDLILKDFEINPNVLSEKFRNNYIDEFTLGHLYFNLLSREFFIIYRFEHYKLSQIENDKTFLYVCTILSQDNKHCEVLLKQFKDVHYIKKLKYIPQRKLGFLIKDITPINYIFKLQIDLLDAEIITKFQNLFATKPAIASKIILIFQMLVSHFREDFNLQFFSSLMLNNKLPLLHAARLDFATDIINYINSKEAK